MTEATPPLDDDLEIDDSEVCEHEDYDVDILEGVARCWFCGHKWEQTPEAIEREIEAQRAYDEYCVGLENERRSVRARFREFGYRAWAWFRFRERTDDDIPF